jgi:hypothetical protein
MPPLSHSCGENATRQTTSWCVKLVGKGARVADQSIGGVLEKGVAGWGRRWNDSLFHRSNKVDDDVALVLGEPIVLMGKDNEFFAGAGKLLDFLSHEPILRENGTGEIPGGEVRWHCLPRPIMAPAHRYSDSFNVERVPFPLFEPYFAFS